MPSLLEDPPEQHPLGQFVVYDQDLGQPDGRPFQADYSKRQITYLK